MQQALRNGVKHPYFLVLKMKSCDLEEETDIGLSQ